MALPFDATLKDLVQTYLPDYERCLGPLTPLNVDLSTISAATDIVLGHADPPDRVVDLNFQSGPDPALGARLLLYKGVSLVLGWASRSHAPRGNGRWAAPRPEPNRVAVASCALWRRRAAKTAFPRGALSITRNAADPYDNPRH
jgi:hypothetical protein